MARGARKTPKLGAKPADGKQVRIADDPGRQDQETITWRFSIVDLEGDWGWRTAASRDWWDAILPKLQDIETMTWAAVMAAAGGRREGNNSHPVKVEDMCKKAQDRLVEIGQEDLEELFSLRLTGTKRIYGIRDRHTLRLVWYDRYHGDNSRAVVPLKGR